MFNENQQLSMNERFASLTFVFVCLGILYLLIFVFLCRIHICILSVFVIIIIIFFALQPSYSWERRKEKSDHLEFIMMMVILSCSSQWLTEAAFVRTLCICVFWPCICILALLMLCSCSALALWSHISLQTNLVFHGELFLIIPSNISCIECIIANLSSFGSF